MSRRRAHDASGLQAWVIGRREALLGLAGMCGAGVLAACGRAAPPVDRDWLAQLPAERRATLAAAIERVLPGALAAGGLAYLAYALARPPFEFAQHELDLAALLLTRAARQRYGAPFAACEPAAQDALLGELAQGAFSTARFNGRACFRRLVTLTLEGFLGDPRYGGNRDEVGWKLIGRHPCWWAPARRRARGRLPY